ncbi:MAG TPA: glycyl-radical enzyme activating protein [Myxococcota bacterium]|nr:glycyl-radical enzyme activating protein [Myxococcota bacterium]
MTGIIFDVQSYAIHDGPGIRTCVYFKGCPLHCSWCHNPESQWAGPELLYWEDRCGHCGDCVPACPNGARSRDAETIIHDAAICTACGKCADACPNEALEIAGYEIDATELAHTIERDRAFFDDSGGGVTFTGGEPTRQAEFLLEMLGRMKDLGIHTAVETCGLFAEDLIGKLSGLVDLFLFDIKHISAERHLRATGASNTGILSNYRKVLAMVGDARLIPRIPLVPGFNCDPDSIGKFVDFFRSTGRHGQIELMPFHGWAVDKYRRMGRDYPHLASSTLSEQALSRIRSDFSNSGLTTVQN